MVKVKYAQSSILIEYSLLWAQTKELKFIIKNIRKNKILLLNLNNRLLLYWFSQLLVFQKKNTFFGGIIILNL